MKAKYIIISFAALAIMAGCSKTKTEAQPDTVTGPDDEWVTDETLPVPVNFSAPQIGLESKASAIRIDALANLEIGVLGVVTTDGVITADLNSANESDAYLPGMKNVKAVVNENPNESDGKTYITFKDGEDADLTIYYPFNNVITYSFYSYYPYVEEVTPSAESFTVEYELGSTDILWAEDHATDAGTVKGFNPKYIRTVAGNTEKYSGDEYAANFNFNHKTTGLRFYAQSIETTPNVTVTGLRLVNVPTKATLYVASKDSGNPSGTLVPAELDMEEEDNNVITLTTSEAPGSEVLNITPSSTENEGKGAEIGTLLVAPATSYQLEVDIKRNDSDETLTIPAVIPEGTYEAGTMYSLSIRVYNAEKVEIYVDLEPWNEDDVEDVIEIG